MSNPNGIQGKRVTDAQVDSFIPRLVAALRENKGLSDSDARDYLAAVGLSRRAALARNNGVGDTSLGKLYTRVKSIDDAKRNMAAAVKLGLSKADLIRSGAKKLSATRRYDAGRTAGKGRQ